MFIGKVVELTQHQFINCEREHTEFAHDFIYFLNTPEKNNGANIYTEFASQISAWEAPWNCDYVSHNSDTDSRESKDFGKVVILSSLSV